MRHRKKWWQVPVFMYTFKVQIFYYLAMLGIVFAVPEVLDIQYTPFVFDENVTYALLFIGAIVVCAWRFSVGAKKEYEENDLGY